MEPELRRLLHATNPWLGDPDHASRVAAARAGAGFLPRQAAAPLRAAWTNERKAHLVIGPRQAGKSSLVWSLLAEQPRHLFLLNAEEPLVREWCTSPGLFLADLDAWLPRGGVLFLEEAQWLEEAGLFLKGLIDADCGRVVVATGSASYHLLSRTRESLAGRATRHSVWPFSLGEVSAGAPHLPAARQLARSAIVDRMLRLGSYPEVWTSSDPEGVLDELVRAFVLRDASDRFRIARPDAFRLVLRLAAGQVGDLVNLAEWASIAGIASSTVADYLALLEETHILRLVRPYLGGKRAELTSSPKVYFLDNGLRNIVLGRIPDVDGPDTGKLFENWVYSEIHKAFPEPGAVRYWRTKSGAEVDFVLELVPGRIIAVEVKASAGSPRPSRSMTSFVEAYRPIRFYGVHRGEPAVQPIRDSQVQWVPAEFLPELLAEIKAGR